MPLGRAVPLVLALALSAPAVAAAPASRPAGADRALDLFEEGARAYREGRFQDAVEKLLEARTLKPEPVLLYNLARAYEALGRSAEAADAYAQYLAEEPATVDRRAIEGRIVTLRAQAAELAAARRPEPKPEPAPPPSAVVVPAPAQPEPESSSGSVVPWLVAGAGAAMMGSGLVFGVVANSKHDDAVAEPGQQRAVRLQDSAETFAQVSSISIIAGAIVAAAGVAWIVVNASGGRTTGPASRAKRSALRPLEWAF